MLKNRQSLLINYLGPSIVLLCAGLLSIWAMQHTIALRNILLSLGSLLSIIYLYQCKRVAPFSMNWRNLMPLAFIGCLFVWVLIHYFLFSQNEVVQLKELKSIWFRSFEASLLGWVCGLAIIQKPSRINFLGYGLIAGFTVLYYQYLPKVLASHSLFHPDHFNYVFYGKINGVLIGTLLIAGVGGHLIDTLSSSMTGRLRMAFHITTSAFMIAIPLYAYVYIFDAKNGIGLAVLLALTYVAWELYRLYGPKSQAEPWKSKLIPILAILLILMLVVIFAQLQFKKHPSWQYLIEDIQESVQIDKHPQWKSPSTLGSPVLPSGRTIPQNVFERVSWATVGLRLVPQNPWGSGILQYPFERSLMRMFPNAPPNSLPGSTHSGWIELLLSFGFPALICLWGALVAVAYGAMRGSAPTKGVVISLVLAIFCLYTVGELSNHHAVEMLLFSITLLAALNIRLNQSSDRI
jgi:hypothetical protein